MSRNLIVTHGYRPFSRLSVATQGYRGLVTVLDPACPPLVTLMVMGLPSLSLNLLESPNLILEPVPKPTLVWLECDDEP